MRARPAWLALALGLALALTAGLQHAAHVHVETHLAGAVDVRLLDALLDADETGGEREGKQDDADRPNAQDAAGETDATTNFATTEPLQTCHHRPGKLFVQTRHKPRPEADTWVFVSNASFGFHTAATVEAVMTPEQAASLHPVPRLVVAWQASHVVPGDDAQRVLISHSDDMGATWTPAHEVPTREHDHGRGAGVPWQPVLFRPPRTASQLMLIYAESRQCWVCATNACRARQRHAVRLWRPGSEVAATRADQMVDFRLPLGRRRLRAAADLHRVSVYSHDGVKYASSARATPSLTAAQYLRIRRHGESVVSSEYDAARGPDAPRWSRGGDVRAMLLDGTAGTWSESWPVLPEEEPDAGDGVPFIAPKLIGGPPIAITPPKEHGGPSVHFQSEEVWMLPFWAEAPREKKAMCVQPLNLPLAPPGRHGGRPPQSRPRIFAGSLVSRDGGRRWTRSPHDIAANVFDTTLVPPPRVPASHHRHNYGYGAPSQSVRMLLRASAGATVSCASHDGHAWTIPEVSDSLPNGGGRVSVIRLSNGPGGGDDNRGGVLLAAVNHHGSFPSPPQGAMQARGNITLLSSDDEGRTWHVEAKVARTAVRVGEAHDAPSLKQVGCYVILVLTANARYPDSWEVKRPTTGVRVLRWRLRAMYCGETDPKEHCAWPPRES